MYPAAFEYVAPSTFEQAIELLERHGPGAKLLAGGCSLVPLMKLRLAEPTHIVDLGRVRDAAGIREEDGVLRIGAMAREADLEHSAAVVGRYPILVDTCSVIADPTVRNMGTVGGNIVHGDPANDHPATMMAMRASFVALGAAGSRIIPAEEFFIGLFETALRPTEILTEIHVPAPVHGSGGAYVKFERQVGDFAIAAAAAWVRLDGDRVADASIVLTNAGSTAIRARAAEGVIVGRVPEIGALREASEAARQGLEPWPDLRGSQAVKLHLAGIAVERALRAAVARARVSGGDRA